MVDKSQILQMLTKDVPSELTAAAVVVLNLLSETTDIVFQNSTGNAMKASYIESLYMFRRKRMADEGRNVIGLYESIDALGKEEGDIFLEYLNVGDRLVSIWRDANYRMRAIMVFRYQSKLSERLPNHLSQQSSTLKTH